MHKDGISSLKKELETIKHQFGNILKGHFRKMGAKEIIKTSKAFEAKERKYKRKLKLMRPKRQLIRLALPQLSAFLFIELLLLLIDTNIPPLMLNTLCQFCIFVAIAFFLYSIFAIYQILMVIIEIQQFKTARYDTIHPDLRGTASGNPGF